MSIVIRVENLSKYYRLGVIGGGTLREDFGRWWALKRGRPDPLLKVGEDGHENRKGGQIWALRDVSFEVAEGEVLGIIGRNGAGKSTLLKILSRITAPTSGRVRIKGRVASLLEVGTGFHPQLTGRENVYLNGTILGMSRREVSSKLEEIVEFAEMGKFIDTPVKRYSSGMSVRLAFAVAAHLEPEILIIDEVLAVGDAEFQKRCIGKMDDVAKTGRTVLFVSHNMASIRQLAPRSVLIEEGRLVFGGPTGATLDRYLGYSMKVSVHPKAIAKAKRLAWAGDRSVEFIEAELVDDPAYANDDPIRIRLRIRAKHTHESLRIGATIIQVGGNPVASFFSTALDPISCGETHDIGLEVHAESLGPGHYWFRLGLINARNLLVDAVDEVLPFEISPERNVPRGFVEWNSGWGFARFRADLVRLPKVT